MSSNARANHGRLDLELVRRGLAPTREKARALIMAGRVRVDGRTVDKAGTAIPDGSTIELEEPPHPFVGRGGVKLEAAIATFGLDPGGATALDVGSSTGGFTDCLLRRGARRVYAVDVGRGLLDWSLREDPRVVVLEGVNARHLSPTQVPEPIDLAAADLAFISLRIVVPAIVSVLADAATVLLMVKPQFELGKGEVGRGVVRDPGKHALAVRQVAEHAAGLGLTIRGVTPSPIRGAKGNREFFLWLERGRGTAGIDLEEAIVLAVATPEAA